MSKEKLSKKEFKEIFSKVPRICVDLVIKTEDGVLFTKRSIEPFKKTWHLPGGGVLLNETLEEASKRIAKRELNLDINLKESIGQIEHLYEKCEGIKRHSISIVFLAEMASKEIKLNEDAEDYLFSKKIPENTIPEQEEFLKKTHKLFS